MQTPDPATELGLQFDRVHRFPSSSNTALMKDNGGNRGIVTGDTFRRVAQPMRTEVRASLHAVPARALHSSRNRLRRARGLVSDGV